MLKEGFLPRQQSPRKGEEGSSVWLFLPRPLLWTSSGPFPTLRAGPQGKGDVSGHQRSLPAAAPPGTQSGEKNPAPSCQRQTVCLERRTPQSQAEPLLILLGEKGILFPPGSPSLSTGNPGNGHFNGQGREAGKEELGGEHKEEE